MTTLLEAFEILDDEPEEVYNVKSILETLTNNKSCNLGSLLMFQLKQIQLRGLYILHLKVHMMLPNIPR